MFLSPKRLLHLRHQIIIATSVSYVKKKGKGKGKEKKSKVPDFPP
jgi:hypothetical protein